MGIRHAIATERIDHWTPRTGLREAQSPGIQAFAETPYATWRLEGCSANEDDPSPCVLSRSPAGLIR